MAKVKVVATDTFHHGALHAVQGQAYTMNKGEADDLEKLNLVKTTSDAGDDEVDDLVGARHKKAPVTSNKMMPKPDNKTDDKK